MTTSYDDISDIHQEIEGYTHCIRVVFDSPLSVFEGDIEDLDEDEWFAWQETPEYEAARLQYQEEAVAELFDGRPPDDLFFDWRDEEELWLRYNDSTTN